MKKYKVRERRDADTNPYPNVIYFTQEDDLLITQTIADIVKEDALNLLAYNICADHIHLLIACDIEEIPSIMQKIKAITAKEVNKTREHTTATREHAPLANAPLENKKRKPLWTQKYSAPKEVTTQEQLDNTLRYIQNNRQKHELPPHINTLQTIIDNMCVSVDKALEPEYTGGFDVVIGNPPYVRKQGLMEHYPEMCAFYETNYQSATANYDIYALFMERSFDLINPKGIVSYILPHKFLITDFGVGIRQFFKEKKAVESILHFGSEMVFADASTYTCIINLDKSKKESVHFKKINPHELATPFEWDYMLYDKLSEQNWDLQSQKVFDTIDTLKQQPYTVDDVFDRIFQGIASGGDKFFTLEKIKNKGEIGLFYSEMLDKNIEIEFGILKPFLKGNQISKYENISNTLYTLFPYKLENNKAKPYNFDQIEKEFPLAAQYYRKNETFLRGREKGRFNNDEEWFLFSRKQGITGVESPKIMTQEISLGCNMTFDEKGEFYHPTTIYSFVKNEKFKVDDKFYLGILNSKVMWFFLKNTGTELRGGYFRFKTNYLKPFPLPAIPENPDLIIDNVNNILTLNKNLQQVTQAFTALLQSKFSIPIHKGFKPLVLSKKLQNWHELDFAEFLKELEKARKKAAKDTSREHDPWQMLPWHIKN
ncbi:hypothetical protein JCM19302_2586 [Jejuia pallidilutea]|uniref:site-specific DNA-methyltransferase (adenine-specific) n=1 Tax=Jejuia pallidilutea TaxID=504487 RepID=A0A090VZE9_9FLAO|nr:TaqI-like C-terminal specificity domain-containing protein [Jejuia pallidilutea]GAL70011.1 hypothetical protein JCM19302_2586 [Jejuia pallidilutea]